MTHPYATVAYAQALSHWGNATWVPQWKTSVITRPIEGSGFDAAGNYPFCVLAEDIDFIAGLEHLRAEGAIAVTLVLNEYHRPALESLKPHVNLLKPFKTHYVYNREKGPIIYQTHHQRALKKAYKQVRVEVLDLKTHGNQWQALYDYLINELHLAGLHAFPAAHHHALAEMEGITAIGAWIEDELVSAHIWAGDGNTQHSHLVASNAKGYECRAGFAVNDFSIGHFTNARLLNFGGGAGNNDDASDGLVRFKRGFANDTAESYLCGIILDPVRYQLLTTSRNKTNSEYFPAYRAP